MDRRRLRLALSPQPAFPHRPSRRHPLRQRGSRGRNLVPADIVGRRAARCRRRTQLRCALDPCNSVLRPCTPGIHRRLPVLRVARRADLVAGAAAAAQCFMKKGRRGAPFPLPRNLRPALRPRCCGPSPRHRPPRPHSPRSTRRRCPSPARWFSAPDRNGGPMRRASRCHR